MEGNKLKRFLKFFIDPVVILFEVLFFTLLLYFLKKLGEDMEKQAEARLQHLKELQENYKKGNVS
jgi:uncharacterized membrane protein